MVYEELDKALKALTLEVDVEIVNDLRSKIHDNISRAVRTQSERTEKEITRLTIDRNNAYDAEAIMRDALERIWRGSDTTMGESAQMSAGKYQATAHDALVAAKAKEI